MKKKVEIFQIITSLLYFLKNQMLLNAKIGNRSVRFRWVPYLLFMVDLGGYSAVLKNDEGGRP